MTEALNKVCEECSINPSIFHCFDCDQHTCEYCDFKIHRGGTRKSHTRSLLCINCSQISSRFCLKCSQNLCVECSRDHSDHTLQQVSNKSNAVVFWDLNTPRVITGEDLIQNLQNIYKTFDSVLVIKVYGQNYFKFRSIFDRHKAEFSQPEGLSEAESILIDISLLDRIKIHEILIISQKAFDFKVHLTQIQLRLPKIKILVSTHFPNLNCVTVANLQPDGPTYLFSPKTLLPRPSLDERATVETASQEEIPIFHNFTRKKGQNYAHDLCLTYLKTLADSGLIMHDSGWFCKTFAQKSRVSIEEASDIIKELEKIGHLRTSERVFCELKTMFFTSLKVDFLSLECVLWTLRSLKLDEMLPTERSIQSRMKEVFDYKPSQGEWASFLDYCDYSAKHQHSKSDSENASYSFFSSPHNLFMNSSPNFVNKFVQDPVSGLKTVTIYPKDQEWDSKDQHIKEGDSLNVKGTSDWDAFVAFFEEYFSNSTFVDDPRAIPGGRYGCAQFLKYCGSPSLKACSLGKLSYMVQLSIDEDLLRYHKTLLVWVPASFKVNPESHNAEKLAKIRQTVYEILKEVSEGLSLAQLPLYIKRKLNFQLDLNELGFAKLKDLLLTMPEIEIELRGANHPFAVYKSIEDKNKEEKVKNAILSILKDYHKGMPGQKLEISINARLGYFVNWTEYKCLNIYEFVHKKCVGMFEVTQKNLIVISSPTEHFELGRLKNNESSTDEPRRIEVKNRRGNQAAPNKSFYNTEKNFELFNTESLPRSF